VFASTEIREMISENLDELSPLLRTAFVLREVQGFSTGEAAKKLGVTENTLKARLWRARQQLAERLGRRLRRMKDGMTGGMGEPGNIACFDVNEKLVFPGAAMNRTAFNLEQIDAVPGKRLE